ncbi:MAG: metallopeptidase TldD-related protein [Gammaproteobacteria bacterium]|nr:metallopeptidase TldD-related protein [Gammaproteobacteria bacterium]
MSDEKKLAEQTLDAIRRAGFDKAACRVSNDELHELQAETGEINLFRTSFETDIALEGIEEERRASLSVNKTDEATIGSAVNDLKTMAAGGNPDPAFDIAEEQPHESFAGGIDTPDYDAMYDRVVELQDYAHETYPTLGIRSISCTFVRRRSCFANSNDVCFETSRGMYQVGMQFSSREGTQTSSMMYTGYATYDLDTPIREAVNVDELLRQSTEQVSTQHIPAKFKGDLVIAPNCLTSFTGFLTARIADGALISGTSVYDDKLGEAIASDKFTLRSMPLADDMAGGYWVTGDGYKAEDLTIVEKGVLKSYLLGLYGANKLGRPRAVNSGGAYVVDAGEASYEDLIRSVGEGILITRFSGGRPNDRGDFSGVAKNSYYIKDGKVQFPIKETTVSGNMVELLQNIDAVSSERLNFGNSLLPWVKVSGITAS